MNTAIQIAASFVGIFALAGFARFLGLGGDIRIADEAHARQLANEAVFGFEPVAMAIDRAGMAAILRDNEGRQLLLRRNGAHFAGRLLTRDIRARLDQNFLVIATPDRRFGEVTLNLGREAQFWAAGLRHLPNG